MPAPLSSHRQSDICTTKSVPSSDTAQLPMMTDPTSPCAAGGKLRDLGSNLNHTRAVPFDIVSTLFTKNVGSSASRSSISETSHLRRSHDLASTFHGPAGPVDYAALWSSVVAETDF